MRKQKRLRQLRGDGIQRHTKLRESSRRDEDHEKRKQKDRDKIQKQRL